MVGQLEPVASSSPSRTQTAPTQPAPVPIGSGSRSARRPGRTQGDGARMTGPPASSRWSADGARGLHVQDVTGELVVVGVVGVPRAQGEPRWQVAILPHVKKRDHVIIIGAENVGAACENGNMWCSRWPYGAILGTLS